jgi:hypothetical protein
LSPRIKTERIAVPLLKIPVVLKTKESKVEEMVNSYNVNVNDEKEIQNKVYSDQFLKDYKDN